MSAGNPFTMFSACVVLPPNDIWKIGVWPLWSADHAFEKSDVSLP